MNRLSLCLNTIVWNTLNINQITPKQWANAFQRKAGHKWPIKLDNYY